jgi:CheY-like chemotaxis protein
VHPDKEIRRLIAESLPGPEFSVRGSERGQPEAVEAFEPDLLLLGLEDLGAEPRLLAAVHGSERHAPIVVLCSQTEVDQFPGARARGADDFLVLPISAPLLEAKTRALLHLAHLGAPRGEFHKATGPVGEEGVVPLLRLCEDEGLTCRLVVATSEARWFADFVDGEMTEAGGVPAVEDHEAFAAMLAVRSGRYEIIEMKPQKPAESTEEAVAVTLRGVIADSKLAALATPPEPPQPQQPTDVDATLLGWAVHFIVEGAWVHLGTAVTSGLLKRTLQEALDHHPALRAFNVGENAHVQVDLAQGLRLPGDAVQGAAAWMSAFLAASRRIAHEVGLVDVRQITRLVGEALDQVGFYGAFDAASGVATRPPTQSANWKLSSLSRLSP